MMKKILAAALMLLISGCSIINRYKDANQFLTGCTIIKSPLMIPYMSIFSKGFFMCQQGRNLS